MVKFVPLPFVKKHILFVIVIHMDHYVLLALIQCDTTFVTFNLWMNQIGFDTFVFIVNYLNQDSKVF
jgi:hypothetical protein